jgi:hypothetical protein
MQPLISLADLLKAFAELEPSTHEQKTAIARVLGLEWKPPAQSVLTVPERKEQTPRQRTQTGAASIIAPRPPQPSLAVAPSAGEDVSFTIAGPSKQDAPSQLWAKPSSDFEALRTAVVAPSVAPLFTPRWTRGIMSTALAVRSPIGQPDIRQIVYQIARGKLLRALPRLDAAAMAQRVEVLIDVGESMLPFAEDQRGVVQSVLSVAGFDNVRVMKFGGTPLRGAGTDDMDEWPESYAFPSPNTHVLLLSDLGIGRPLVSGAGASADEWLRFASELRRRGIACTAFVPYPSKRWPQALAAQLRLVEWDRATTAGTVRFSR